MTRRGKVAERSRNSQFFFDLLFGGLLGLALLKFGNPVVVSNLVDWPRGGWEWIFMSWPPSIAYACLGVVVIIGAVTFSWQGLRLHWIGWMLLAWFGWQCVSAVSSVEPQISKASLGHMLSCVVCFYLGYVGLGRSQRIGVVWAGILCGFILVLADGFQQHFGGLEETRRQFALNPSLQQAPAELIKRMASGRIFATLFYPNTLAGAILLLLPPVLAFLWRCDALLARDARLFLVAVVGIAGLACLYWSGSKSGWLLLLAQGLAVVLWFPFARKWKALLVAMVIVVGLTGFFWRYAGYFHQGAKSVDARLGYWQAAVKITLAHPVLGSGPGTFGVEYRRIKRPESEMSLEVHNDYLQQASDSGFPGFIFYAIFVVTALVASSRRNALSKDVFTFAVWLGVFAWSLQGLSEFGLYIPALAWPAFAFLGWLLGRPANHIDTYFQPS